MSAPSRSHSKAEFIGRKLISELQRLHIGQQSATGCLQPGSGVAFDDLDGVLFPLDQALVSVRTLDTLLEEVLKASYVKKREKCGMVVRGLTAPRNAAVHYDDLIEPDLSRAVGPLDGYFIVWVRWKPQSTIPPAAFAKTSAGALKAYDSHVAGRLLHDTLLDAIQFFDQCDSQLFRRDHAGQIAGLPLPPLPVGGYHRLHPDWPTHEEVELKIRSTAQASAPAGLGRHVDGVLTLTPYGTFLCGYTDLPHGRRQVFTEPVAQVVSDVKGGYRYEAVIDGNLHPFIVDSGSPFFNGQPLGRAGIADLSDTEPWRGWAELVATDASYYRDQRQAE